MSTPVRIYWGLLVRYLAAQRGRVLLLAGVLLFSGIGLQLVSPQLLRGFIDGARAGAPMETLVVAALLFMGAALLQQILYVGSTYVSELVGWNATNALRTDLLAHALRLDMGFHNARTPGELLRRYRRARVITDGTRVVARVIFACGQAAALAVGAYLFYQGAATVGTALMIAYYTSLIVWPLEQLSHQLQDLQQAGTGIRRVQELREAAPTIVDGAGASAEGKR